MFPMLDCRGGGQAVQGGLSCPPPGYFFFLLIPLGSYYLILFVSIIIKIQVDLSGFLGGSISYLGCRGGGQAVQGGLSCPPPG